VYVDTQGLLGDFRRILGMPFFEDFDLLFESQTERSDFVLHVLTSAGPIRPGAESAGLTETGDRLGPGYAVVSALPLVRSTCTPRWPALWRTPGWILLVPSRSRNLALPRG
jgi:hypothetical protein